MVLMLGFAASAAAAEFGKPGAPVPAGIDEVLSVLRQDPYVMEMLISYGTSKGGSAGHLALAIRDPAQADDTVYSANFYADRSEQHSSGFYTAELMTAIPKREYLFQTASHLGDTAQFGLDFGEVYKRSVIGVRVYGVPQLERDKLVAFFKRINDDYHRRASKTEYHGHEIVYDYMNLNCAKTIGAGFKYGADYADLDVKSGALFYGVDALAARHANLPTEMAVKLMKEWDARGYRMDTVLYTKYAGSTYVDPHEEKKVAFKDLPNRFPSVLSFDFRAEEGRYEDYDNLFAMYLLYNLGKYGVKVNEQTGALELEKLGRTLPYARAVEVAAAGAQEDSNGFLARLVRPARGRTFDGLADNSAVKGGTDAAPVNELPPPQAQASQAPASQAGR